MIVTRATGNDLVVAVCRTIEMGLFKYLRITNDYSGKTAAGDWDICPNLGDYPTPTE